VRKGENCLINIADVKKNFSKRYPDHPLTKVMLIMIRILCKQEIPPEETPSGGEMKYE